MKRRQFLTLLAATGLLPGCTSHEIRRGLNSAQQLSKGDVPSAISAHIPSTGLAPLDQLVRDQLKNLVKELAKNWGDEKIATPKEYVKYTDQYLSRAIVNFDTGRIRVETVDPKQPDKALKAAIISTLLTPENPSKVDLLSDKAIQTGQTPFLYDLVVDQDKKPVGTQWRANRYADYLMKHAYTVDTYNGKKRRYVTFEMVKDHNQAQQKHYASYVNRQSKRFGIESALIYAIIETESSFNPYAMSHIPAYGLMQIVPQSAGRDAYRFLYKKDGTPSKDYLFQADKNIEMGTVYLHILFTRYLKDVKNPKAREYCCIAAYNTGSGNVLKAFDTNRSRAFTKINAMSANAVYGYLRQHLKYEEARNYLYKVTQKKRGYV
ncbi:MAG: murein transglycosylase domain-containing protein [Hydrogenovibrio sp.]